MNVYDSDKMVDVLADSHEQVSTPEGADMVILNTCHIREKAEEKVFSDIGRLRKFKNKNPDMIIAVAGCVAQAEGEQIMKRSKLVDMVFGPQVYHRLPEMVKEAEAKSKVIDLDFPAITKFDSLPVANNNNRKTAFVSVQEGCDKFCAFCVVPYTRGAEYSRDVAEIIAETKTLVSKGVIEVNLLGQNVNAFHGKNEQGNEVGLAYLIGRLNEIDGLKRIRYTTSHPRDMDDELIAAHGKFEKLMPYLHLPIQAGSDKILKAMNRKHTRDFYIDIINRMRDVRGDMAFSGDFIVGFPGETDADFEDTLKLVESVFYQQAYSFKYSIRPGTPAAESNEQIDEAVKTERLARLQDLLNLQQEQFNEQTLGKQMPVLFERAGKLKNQYIGKSPYMQSVHVISDHDLTGQLLDVKITSAGANSVKGEIAKNDLQKAA